MTCNELEKTVKALTYRHIVDALCDAFQIHNSTNQTYGINKPYSVHLQMVFNEALNYIDIFPNEDYQAILFGAAFHDAIEDARLKYNDVLNIAKKYMENDKALLATEIVYALTNEKGRNRAERANDNYYEGIRNTPYAAFVKLADRLANMKFSVRQVGGDSMLKKYKDELPHFLDSIQNKENKDIKYSIPEEMIEEILHVGE